MRIPTIDGEVVKSVRMPRDILSAVAQRCHCLDVDSVEYICLIH